MSDELPDAPPTAPGPPIAPQQQQVDAQHLHLLSVFHYILGGVTALFSFCPSFYLAMGIIFLVNPEALNEGSQPPPPGFATMMGVMFIAFPAALMIAGWIYSVLLIYAGRSLSARRRYMLCLVIAGISCIWIPLGTVLGVFTLVVLLRQSVKHEFEVA